MPRRAEPVISLNMPMKAATIRRRTEKTMYLTVLSLPKMSSIYNVNELVGRI